MKLAIIKPCTTPEGRHAAGDRIETSAECAEYLLSNGYAKPASAIAKTAEAPMAEAENAALPSAKRGRPPKGI